MQTLKFNKKSIHYSLARLGGFTPWEKSSHNICAYTGFVSFGVLLSLCFVLVVFILVGIPAIAVTYDILHWTGTVTTSPETNNLVYAGNGEVMMYGMFGVWWVIGYLRHHLNKNSAEVEKVKTDGFVKNVYASFKHKYCIKIEFK